MTTLVEDVTIRASDDALPAIRALIAVGWEPLQEGVALGAAYMAQRTTGRVALVHANGDVEALR
jgi:hypothetical protein